MAPKVFKIWSVYCGTCADTARFDTQVLAKLGLDLEYISGDTLDLESDISQEILKVYPDGDYPIPLYIQPLPNGETPKYIEGGMSEMLFRIFSKEEFVRELTEEEKYIQLLMESN